MQGKAIDEKLRDYNESYQRIVKSLNGMIRRAILFAVFNWTAAFYNGWTYVHEHGTWINLMLAPVHVWFLWLDLRSAYRNIKLRQAFQCMDEILDIFASDYANQKTN